MKKLPYGLMMLLLLFLFPVKYAGAQVSIGNRLLQYEQRKELL